VAANKKQEGLFANPENVCLTCCAILEGWFVLFSVPSSFSFTKGQPKQKGVLKTFLPPRDKCIYVLRTFDTKPVSQMAGRKVEKVRLAHHHRWRTLRCPCSKTSARWEYLAAWLWRLSQ
jgi:hypothetical protein